MYQEAEVYVRNRIELEKALKENDRLARLYYKEGKLEEAKALWQKIIKEAEPVPIDLKF
jgi:tetratricopeptide (TPR) repeat protein